MTRQVALGDLIVPANLRRAGDGDLPLLSMTMHGGLVDQAHKFKKRIASADTSAYKRVRRDQLVVGFPIDEGVLSFQTLYDEAIVSPAYEVWDLRQPGLVAPRFLERVLRSPRALAYYRSKLRGTTARRRTIPDDLFLSLPISLPDINEQVKVITLFEKADSLRRKRQEALHLADEFLGSAYLDLAKKHRGRASVESVLANIANAARTGPFGSQMLVSEFTESGIPVLGIDNVVSNAFTWGARRFVSPEKYAELERYTVRPGDVMVTIMGTTGRVAVAPDDLPLCISTKHLCTLSLDQQEMRPFYLWACLRWDPEVRAQTQRESKGAIMEGWNMGIVKGLMVSKPPLDAQLRFETLLARIGRFSKSAGNAADETNALIASLSAKYLDSPISV